MYELGVLILHWDCHNLSTAVIKESLEIPLLRLVTTNGCLHKGRRFSQQGQTKASPNACLYSEWVIIETFELSYGGGRGVAAHCATWARRTVDAWWKTGSSDLSHFFNTPVLEHGDYRFFGTVSASKASCSPGGTKKGQLGFITTNLFFCSLEVLVIFH